MPAPIWDMLIKFRDSAAARFHMPGHMGRLDGFGEIAALDVTETAGIDCLHNPVGAVAEAERLAAKAYGADNTFFLVNGASAGVIAMMAECSERVILHRGCHKSAISGAVLFNKEPVFVYGGLPSAEDIARELEKCPADVFITNPDYYGRCCDVEGIVRTVHKYGVRLFVDESHGAHFAFSDMLPISAGKAGADMWVNSAHKTLGALTQGAFLHTAKSIDASRVRQILALLQTSSPSYPILASLDISREKASVKGEWDKHIIRSKKAAEEINYIEGLRVIARTGCHNSDPTRIVVDVSGRGLTGYKAQTILNGKGVYSEMADAASIVFITTPFNTEDDFARLIAALRSLPKFPPIEPKSPEPPILDRVIPMREAYLGKREFVAIKDCAGRVCAGCVGTYPPGTPIVAPGENITAEAVSYLIQMKALGADIFGADEKGSIPVVLR